MPWLRDFGAAVWQGFTEPFRLVRTCGRAVVHFVRAPGELRAALREVDALRTLASRTYFVFLDHGVSEEWLVAFGSAMFGKPFNVAALPDELSWDSCEAERKLEALDARLAVMRAAVASIGQRFHDGSVAPPEPAYITRTEYDAILTAAAPLGAMTSVGRMLDAGSLWHTHFDMRPTAEGGER